jgi:hypothetical protein
MKRDGIIIKKVKVFKVLKKNNMVIACNLTQLFSLYVFTF